MLKRILQKDDRGSFVVEAAIIFPIIILLVLLVIYICFALYQQTYLQALANEACEKGASTWVNTSEFEKEFNEKIGVSGLYWRIYDSSSDKKEEVIENFVFNSLEASKDKVEDLSVKAEIKNFLIYKKVVVTIGRKIKTPFDGVKKFFGLEEGLDLIVQSEAVINDPTENIRNTDFVISVIEDTGLDTKIKDIMTKIKNVIGNFF